MSFSQIVAVAENGVIGMKGTLPWHISEDLKWFKKQTLGKPVVMGRKTFESIGRPLPGRDNIVLSSNPDFRAEGCRIFHDLNALSGLADPDKEVMIIGGASLYRDTLPLCNRLYLTRVHIKPKGDTFYPEFHPDQWKETFKEDHPNDELPFTFFIYDRVSG